jgi:hypothetical protein
VMVMVMVVVVMVLVVLAVVAVVTAIAYICSLWRSGCKSVCNLSTTKFKVTTEVSEVYVANCQNLISHRNLISKYANTTQQSLKPEYNFVFHAYLSTSQLLALFEPLGRQSVKLST